MPKTILMDNSHPQVILFQYIKSSLPGHVSLVDQVADLLNLSIDSAYRRIRGEKEISLSELKTLCEFFKISLDQVLEMKNDLVVFQAPEINQGNLALDNYLREMLKYVQYFNSFNHRRMLYFCKDITFFHFYLYPEIASFKTFFWSKTIKDLPEYRNKVYSLEEFPFLDCFELGQQIIREYNKIPSLELWNAESINSTISQIMYYKEGGYFKNPADLNVILDSFQSCLDHIQHEVEQGVKFMPGDSEVVYGAPLQFYINEVIIGSNNILVELDQTRLSFLTYNVLSYLITKDPRFNEKSFSNFFTLVSRSSQISGTGEKDRNRFFNEMRQRIRSLKY